MLEHRSRLNADTIDSAGSTRPALLHSALEHWAERAPDAVAVVDSRRTVTYAELDQRANALAAALRARGVGPGARVALLAERSLEAVIGIVAVLKAGAAYVPLDPAYPDERLRFILDDSRPALTLTVGAHRGRLPPSGSDVLLIDEARPPTAPVSRLLHPRATAYIIYTSGSTGNPKGVAVDHAAIVNFVAWATTAFDIRSSDAVVQQMSLCFDPSLYELFVPLSVGARIVVARAGGQRDATYLAELMRDERVSVICTVPSVIRMLLDTPQFSDCAQLRYVFTGGEVQTSDLVRRVHARTSATVVNLYGPTEAVVACTFRVCERSAELPAATPIGRPIAGGQAVIVDEDLQPVPPGTTGELLLGGAILASSYFDRPDLTAARFVPSPLVEGERLYRTGDLARAEASGELDFVGRVDDQIKLRGFRIELGEVEAAMRALAGVGHAAAAARTIASGDAVLAGYVVRTDELLDEDTVRARLAEVLPAHMVPQAIVFLPSLPLSSNGKVDRKALPTPQLRSTAWVAPRTPLELHLTALLGEVLGVAKVGIEDNFFDLGGNSLNAAAIMGRLQRESGELFHVAALFEAPTVAQLAPFLERHYPDAVGRFWGGKGGVRREAPRCTVDASTVRAMRELITPLGPRPTPTTSKNPRAIFVLSPPRSGTTLLRVILGGNSKLFAPPELELLNYHTMGDRKRAHSGWYASWGEGAVRAVMEAYEMSTEAAQALIAGFEQRDASTQAFYAALQARIGGRMLVDKTTGYELDVDVMEHAEREFEAPLYIHLVRHPCGMMRSFEEAKLDQIFFRKQHPFEPRQLAELCWTVGHQNILTFLADVPAERQLRVRFEDLVAAPDQEIARLCAFAGLELEADMLRPQEDKKKRMTDGLHKQSTMIGDWKFFTHAGIEASAAESWREFYGDATFLGEPTQALIREFGFPKPTSTHSVPIDLVALPDAERRATTFGEERTWNYAVSEPASKVLTVTRTLRIRGPLDVDAFARALDSVIERHEVYRTIFATEEGVVTRRLLEQRPQLRVDERAPAPGQSADDLILAYGVAHYDEPWDFVRGPLFAPALLRIGHDDHAFFAKVHHAIIDASSWRVFFGELVALYGSFVRSEQPQLRTLPFQVADYADWQRRWLARSGGDSAWQAQRDFWAAHLDGAPQSISLPRDASPPEKRSYAGRREYATISPEILAGLKRVGRARNMSMFTLAFAAYTRVIGRFSGQRDLVIGVPVSLRKRPELGLLVGYFINHLPVRMQSDTEEPLVELLERTHSTAMSLVENMELPVAEALQLASTDNFYQVRFNYITQKVDPPIPFAGLETELVKVESSVSPFELSLYVEQTDRLELMLRYQTELFHPKTIVRLLEEYERTLTELLDA